MSSDPTSKQIATLLTMLEDAEQEIDNSTHFALRQLAGLREEAEVALESDPRDEGPHNPIVERIAAAMVKRRAQGA